MRHERFTLRPAVPNPNEPCLGIFRSHAAACEYREDALGDDGEVWCVVRLVHLYDERGMCGKELVRDEGYDGKCCACGGGAL